MRSRSKNPAFRMSTAGLEVRHRSAIIAEDSDLETAKGEAGADDHGQGSARAHASCVRRPVLSNFLIAHKKGRRTDGAEAELQAAAGVTGIPIELFEPAPERRSAEQRAVTPAPGTVGVNLDPIRPFIFANSIAARLGIDMPRVPSGTFAHATITTAATAEPKGKGRAIAATAGALTVATAVPKRISARLELAIEDIAAVGQSNFESVLRQNLTLSLADELDNQIINGDRPNSPTDDQVAILEGVFSRLANPGAPGRRCRFR